MTDADPSAAAGAAQRRYTVVAIGLHWIIALLILCLIAVGWIMGDMPDGEQKFAVIQLHKSFGITVLVLSIARVVWRLMNPPPPEPPMPALQGAVARLVHAAFYVLIIAMPLSGWAMVSASPSGIATKLFQTIPWPHLPGLAELPLETKKQLHEPLEFVHSKLAWVILVLLALHVAGALKHQFIDRDGLMARMAPGLFGRTEGPMRAGRGLLPAFGAAILVLALGGAIGAMANRPAASVAASDAAGAPAASSAPYWDVDAAQSGIAFHGAYMGRPFEGRFKDWTSTIQFDPARPEDARIRVVIKTVSALTGEAYFDENVDEGDWFNVIAFPEAVFEVNEGVFKDSDTRYEATGVLTLKGERFPLRLPFELTIDGDTARMHGEATLSRTGVGVGRATLTAPKGDDEWVADDVKLVVDVLAKRRP